MRGKFNKIDLLLSNCLNERSVAAFYVDIVHVNSRQIVFFELRQRISANQVKKRLRTRSVKERASEYGVEIAAFYNF